MAWIIRCQTMLRSKKAHVGPLMVDELQAAEQAIVATVQWDVYPQKMKFLSRCNSGNANVNCGSKHSLLRLKPIISAGLLRVGGRLRRSSMEFNAKHPIILPPDAHITRSIVEDHHVRMGHSGMTHTWTSIRQHYWIKKRSRSGT